mmetsp:Transcript_33106/g.113903  ORF Transcript_33106/g.113903 Transcript_33106/m.113903 type:complete len:84 (+) Transcript_33106:740-991(+)
MPSAVLEPERPVLRMMIQSLALGSQIAAAQTSQAAVANIRRAPPAMPAAARGPATAAECCGDCGGVLFELRDTVLAARDRRAA